MTRESQQKEDYRGIISIVLDKPFRDRLLADGTPVARMSLMRNVGIELVNLDQTARTEHFYSC